MRHRFVRSLSFAGVVTVGATVPVHAQASGDVVNIKVLTDMDSHYSDSSGKGWVKAVRMAWRI